MAADMRPAICLFVCFGLALARHEIYDGYSVYQVSVNNVNQVSQVHDLETALNLDVWSHSLPNHPGLVLVDKEKKQIFEAELNNIGVDFKVESENVKELLDLEDRLLAEAASKPRNATRIGRVDSLPFDRIYSYEEVDAFLEEVAAAYPETVTLVNAGKSFEGRDIKYLKISTTNFQDTSKPVVYMESLLHAREWVTLPASLYAIHKLVIDVTESDLVDSIDWIILPIANPDGYAWTHTSTGARFWRKNRATGYMIGDACMGVDLNRNFDAFWSTASSNFVCLDTFHGRSAFSEPETAIIRDILLEHKDRLELFLDIHSFGSMILYGWGNGQLPSNALFIHLVGVNMAQAIDRVKESFNPNYVVGNVAHVLYDASGSAGDYGLIVGAPYSYTYELPGFNSFGVLGFLVDPAFIEQVGFETWEGIKVGARYARDNYRYRG